MTTKFQLREKSQTITDFTNYQVTLIFKKPGTSPSLGEPTSVILTSNHTGLANFEQDNLQVDGNINITVKAPSGNIIATKDIEKTELINRSTYQFDFVFSRVDLPGNFVLPAGTINGRLLDISGKRKLDEIQIIIYASVEATPDQFIPLFTVTTETGGYFLASYPQGEFNAAQALVGIESPGGKNKIAITLDKNQNGKGIFPKRLILVLEAEESNEIPAKSDCGCEDLNFHEPKRILDEFSYYSIIRTSDPEIKAYAITEHEEISLEDLLKVSPTSSNPIVGGIIADPIRVFGHPTISPAFHSTSATARVAPSARPGATAAASVSAENISQALKNIKIRKSVVRDFMDKYKVLNKDTYLNLLEMNDAEKINHAVQEVAPAPLGRAVLSSNNLVDWDNDPTIYQSTSIAFGHLLQFKQQWIADGYSLGDLVYSLPLAPGQKKQIVVFDWERRESASNRQSIDYEESLENLLSRDRDINEIASGVVNEKMNGSSSSTVKSASAGFGASIGPLVLGASGGISKGSSTATQNSMRSTAARDSQHLTDKTIQSANAVRSQRSTVVQTVSQGERYEVSAESVANYNHCHALTIQYFEVLRHFKVQQKLVEAQECLFVPLPISTFDIDKARRWREILMASLRDKSLRKCFDSLQRVKDHWEHSDFPATTFAAENILNLTGAFKVKIELTCPSDKLEEQSRTVTHPLGGTYQEKYTIPVYDESQWLWITELLGKNAQDFYNTYIKDQSNKDAIFRKQLGDKISQAIIENFDFKVIDENGNNLPATLDASLASTYHNGVPLSVSIRSGLTGIPREKFIYLKVRLKSGLSLPDFTKILVVSGSANYRTKHMTHRLFNYAIINDDLGVGDSVMIYCGPTHEEMRNPKEDDVESVNKLIHHLNANLEYYHKMMWLHMTAERRFMLLDGINLFVEREQINRSVASVVANKLIGIVGNSLVLPVIPGLNLNPDFSPRMLNEATGEIVPLIDYYSHEPLDALSISVPTNGVFAEAMMGKCNSCELKDEQRFWRWEESPIPDSPTAISPIVTPTPTVTQPNLQATPLANPVVNIQNAPAAPDPQGLSGILNLLGKGDTFRDVTGLTENQKNAMAGLQASFDSTNKFGQMGLDLKKANLTHDIEAKKLDMEAQKQENEKSMRQQKLNTMAQLLKDKVINKEDFDKYMATEGTSPELKNMIDANKAEKSGDITKEQKDAVTPKSNSQKIDELKQKEVAIKEAVSNGSMTPEKGKELIGKLYGDALNDASTKGYTPDDIAAMTKAVSDNNIGSLSATPDNVEIKGQQDTTSMIIPEAWADVEQLNSNMKRTFNPDKNDKSGKIEVEALVSDAPSGAKFNWSTDKPNSLKIVSSDKKKTEILAGEPGITSLFFEILDRGNKSLRRVSMYIGVPQFFIVMDSSATYSADDRGRGFTDPHTFDTVLNNLGLLAEKNIIVRKIKEYTESRIIRKNPDGTFSGHNLRIIWSIGDINEGGLPANIFNPNNIQSPKDSDGYYNVISIGGYSPVGTTLFGVTQPNPDQPNNPNGPRNFIESIRIFTGTFEINSLAMNVFSNPEDRDVYERANKLITEFKANPTDARLKDLMIESFSRLYADVICHEIYHSVIFHRHDSQNSDPLRRFDVIDAGYDPGGHTLPPEKDLMSVARDFMTRTAINVTDPVQFPIVGSYIIHDFAKNSLLNDNNSARIDLFFPIPTTLPFDR